MRVGVVGGGLMGSGIAEVCARSGVDVTVVEADEARAERSRGAIERSLDRGVRAGKLSGEDRSAAMDRLAFTASLEDVEGADAAIEAIIEDERAKRELFARLDQDKDGKLSEAELRAAEKILLALDADEDGIRAVRIVLNPDKLRHLSPAPRAAPKL
jgi:glycine/D-amino acid oxidase-like deaminating enzyme